MPACVWLEPPSPSPPLPPLLSPPRGVAGEAVRQGSQIGELGQLPRYLSATSCTRQGLGELVLLQLDVLLLLGLALALAVQLLLLSPRLARRRRAPTLASPLALPLAPAPSLCLCGGGM